MNMNRTGVIVGDALRQAFMPKDEYESLREEEKVWGRLQRPLVMMFVTVIWVGIVVSAVLALVVVFPGKGERPFCQKRRIQALPSAAYLLTEEEAVQYFWFGLFLPTNILIGVSIIYLLAGIAVAYSAPQRHGCLKIVENNYCTSKRGVMLLTTCLNAQQPDYKVCPLICFAVSYVTCPETGDEHLQADGCSSCCLAPYPDCTLYLSDGNVVTCNDYD